MSETQRVVVTNEPKRGRFGRAVEALQERLSQTVETVSRSSRIMTAGSGVDDIEPPEDIDEHHATYRSTGIVRANINQFVRDVTKPGVRLEAEDDATQAYFTGGEDTPDFAPEGGFLENCAVLAGEKRQPFYPLLQSSITHKWTRGTNLVEYLKESPENADSEISGFKQIRPETVSARTYANKNVLLDPDDTETAASGEMTKRGEAAAYVQFDQQSILGRRVNGFDEDSVYLSQNDVLKQVLDPDIGGDDANEHGVFGTSIIESIADDVAEYKEIKRDRAKAIKTKAYGIWSAEFETNVIELPNEVIVEEWPSGEQDDWINEVGELAPGEIVGHDGSVGLNKFEGSVPEVDEPLQHYVDDILGPLPAPKYATAHGEKITQHVTGEQSESYDDLILEERQAQARDWTQAFRLVAERHPQLDPAGLQLLVEPEESASPVMSLDDEDIERLKEYTGAMADVFGPGGAPAFVDEELLLTQVLQLPEDAIMAGAGEGPAESDEEALDETDEQVREQFEALMNGAPGANGGGDD